MQKTVKSIFNESIEAKRKAADSISADIEKSAGMIIKCFEDGGKLLICGNGGSAADSQHFATELVVRYEKDRKALPAIALTTDTSLLTACSNDLGFGNVFSRQVEALGTEKDVLFAISTSGNSPNIIKAVEAAKKRRMKAITLTGKGGGKMKNLGDVNIIVPSQNTARVQEVHITAIHAICAIVENHFSGEKVK